MQTTFHTNPNSAAGPPFGATGRLDQSDLAPAVQGYFKRGLPSSTQSIYKATKYDISTPFPVTEQILCYFSVFLVNQGLSPQTGKSYLAAVHSMQISLGLPDPREQSSMPILKRVQAGISPVSGFPLPSRFSEESITILHPPIILISSFYGPSQP